MSSFSSSFGNQGSEPRSNPKPNQIYDVFISFRGEDTRRSFTSHLYTALTKAGVNIFSQDDDMLRSGDQILSVGQIMLEAIEGSRISIIIFSKNYASSRWCLQELEKIMECRRIKGQVVVPVFYDVHPSEVRHQTGIYGEAFEYFGQRNTIEKDKVSRWRNALWEASTISGFDAKDFRDESYLIKNIVERVIHLLDWTDFSIAQYPVGVEQRLQDLIQLLNNQYSKDVLLLGIWGMGGIGKTTVAKAIYNKIGFAFDGKSFLLNIRDAWVQDNGQVCLQEHLLSDIYKTTKIKIHSIESGKWILKEKLHREKVLIILDDVDQLEQLNALCGSREWFGPGSIIIITTRDVHLLKACRADYVYRMKEMDESESIELFSWHAFKQASPTEEYVGLSRNVVAYSGGLPLALEVLGSSLFERTKEDWKSVLEKLKRIPNHHIQEMLRISYDRLDDMEKDIFLDIACFFIGMDRNDVIQILNGCGFFAEIGITVLVERGLVTIDYKNKLRMHDLLRDMGREIIRTESPKEPEKRSRLWVEEDVLHVLSNHSGTKAIEGLALKIPGKTSSLHTKGFEKMKRLRLLQLAGVKLEGDFRYLSRHLRWVCWHGFPLRYIPTNFYQGNLVALELEYSNLKLVWKEAQLLKKLKILNLSHSHYLTQTPDFLYLPNLEKLILKDCTSLSAVSDTIGDLNNLVLLNVEDCTNLHNLPRSIYKLKSLKTLILSGCSMIDKLEEDVEQMEALTTLNANNTAIRQVPFSTVRSKSIGYISLCGFEGLSRDVFPSLIWSWMSPRNNISSLVQTSADLSSLVSLDVSSSYIPSPILNVLSKLRSLWMQCGSVLQLTREVARIVDSFNATNSKELESTPTASPVLNIRTSALNDFPSQSHFSRSKGSLNNLLIQMGTTCQVTNILRESIFQKLNSGGSDDCLLPGDNYPNWLTFNCDGTSVIFKVPQVKGRTLKRMTFCIVYFSSPHNTISGLKILMIINYTKATIQVYKRDALASKYGEWQSVMSSLEPGNKVEVVVVFGNGFIVKKTAVYLIYDEDEPIDKKMEHCLAPDTNVLVSGGDENMLDVPVSYGVDPSEVRNQTGMFGEAFEDRLKEMSAKKDIDMMWRKAFREAGGISGVIKDSRNKSEDIKNTHVLDRTHSSIASHPVGIESHVQCLIELLKKQESEGVLLLGIWGMGGIGKTTIAKAIYNRIACKFKGSSFLQNIREAWEQYTRPVHLQKKLLFDIYRKKIKIQSIESGKKILKKWLRRINLLLVLDDVNKLEQLNALCGGRDWFGPGSVIIITTRDKSLLSELGVDRIYRMKEMNERESVELFSWHAFKQDSPRGDFAGHSRYLVTYSGGLPLALVVLGTELFGRAITQWESTVSDRLIKRIPHPEIQKVLKISFDGLNDDREKDIFLEIACFFVGIDRNVVIHELKGYGSFAEEGISVLEKRSLITVDKNKLGMHVLLRDMGRGIIGDLLRIQPGPRIYETFLSFRGEDTRGTFTAHLYTYLQNAGIDVYRDNEELQGGDRVSISLLQAIERSRSCVVVLSKNYANSRWCLVELEKIMVCRRTIGLDVVPVFYDVNPLEVRKQSGMFGEAFDDLLVRISVEEDKVRSWRKALWEIAGIKGIVVKNFRDESEAINKVVEDVTCLLGKTDMSIAENPVGVQSRVQDVIEVLNNKKSKDVLLLGIWGMGGIGKTTIAKAIYNEIGRDFKDRSFLLDIREAWKTDSGRVDLQQRLLSNIYKTTKQKIQDIESGKKILEKKLGQKRILVVLDNVDKLEQLNALFGSRTWYRLGSIIIITTRDKRLLSMLEVDHVCTIKQMDESESLELFSWYAFKKASPREDFAELSSAVVKYSGGLPLALEVLGSYLFDRGLAEWNCVLETLKEIPRDRIQEKLKISFDGLSDDIEKEIFLDIAFFFIGMDRNDVIHILNDYGNFVEFTISVLVERSLVTVDNKNKLGMHDLLRAMGRDIIRKKFPKDPEKRSRLWFQRDVLNVLSKHMKAKAVEGLELKLPRNDPIRLKMEAFKEMKKLRLLLLDGVKLVGDFKHLSRDLRWLCWHGFPLKYTPKNFYQENLVSVELEYSNLKLVWKETKRLERLKVLNLSHSHYLKKTPDFSYLPKLEKLILKDCPRLSLVSDTIERLNELHLINFEDCTSLVELPRSIYKLKSLKTLILSRCSNILKLEEDLEQMESLADLIADKTALTLVPFAVVRLKSIGYISLCGFEGFSREVFYSLFWFWTSPRNDLSSLVGVSPPVSLYVPNGSFHGILSIFSDLSEHSSIWVECGLELLLTRDVARILETFYATNCKELEATATTRQVSNMKTSASIYCHSSGQFDIFGSKKPLHYLLIQMGMNCQITNILIDIFQKLPASGLGDCLPPGDNYPNWLTFNGEGSSVIFEVPQVKGHRLKTMTLCILHSSSPDIKSEGLKYVLIINYTKNIIQVYKRDKLTTFEEEECQRIISILETGNKVEVVVVFGYGFIVKRTAVYLIYNEPMDCHEPVLKLMPDDEDEEDEFDEPLKKRSRTSITPKSGNGHGRGTSKSSKRQRLTNTVGQKRTRNVSEKSPETTLSHKKSRKDQDTPFEAHFHSDSIQIFESSTFKEVNLSEITEQVVESLNVNPSEEVPFSSPRKIPDILDLNVEETTPKPDRGKAPMEFDILEPTHDSDEDPFAEVESILSGCNRSSSKSAKSSSFSFVDTFVKEALNNLQCLLKNSLTSLLQDPELCQQLQIALDCLDDAADDLPFEVGCLVENMKTDVPNLLDHFRSTQDIVSLHKKHLDRKNSLSQTTSVAKRRQEQLIAKISEVKSEAECVDLEIAEAGKRLDSLVRKKETLAAELEKYEDEKKKLTEKARRWVQESKEVVAAVKSSESNYKAALKKQEKMNEDWELFGKRLADNIKELS